MANDSLRLILRYLSRTACAAGTGGMPDAQLLERFVRQRDEAAFEVLVWRHGPMVQGVCRRLLSNPHDVEDAFQATFLALVRKAGSISKRQVVGSWLYKVAYRVALRARSQGLRRAGRELQGAEFVPSSSDEDPVWRDLRPVLDEELNRLPDRYRTAFLLCAVEGKTMEEAAQQLGCPRGTVSSRLVRARERLRSRLLRRGVTLSAGALAAALGDQLAAAPVPAELVGAAVRLARTTAAGQALVGGAVSERVASLTREVLNVMWFTKATWAAVLVVVTVIGVGVSALAYRGRAAEPTAGSDDTTKPPAPGGFVNVFREDRGKTEDPAVLLARAREELQKLEADLRDSERQWTEQLIAARKDQVTLEERLRMLERRQAAERNREGDETKVLEQRQQQLRARLQEYLAELDEVRAGLKGPNVAKLAEYHQKETVDQLRELGQQLRDWDEVIAKKEEERSIALIQVRLDLVTAEERLHLLERRQAAEQSRKQADLEALQERLRQFQGTPATADPSTRRLQELEKKLDALQRELGELRKELRRPG